MLKAIKDKIIHVNPADVIDDAREKSLDVESLEDFRDRTSHYHSTEQMMDDYRFRSSAKAHLAASRLAPADILHPSPLQQWIRFHSQCSFTGFLSALLSSTGLMGPIRFKKIK